MTELTEEKLQQSVKLLADQAAKAMDDLQEAAAQGAPAEQLCALAHLYGGFLLQSERAGISGEITLAMQNVNRAIRDQRLRGRKVEQVYDLMKFQFEQVSQHVLQNFSELNTALREVLTDA